jgi:SAM-dependent methyltransferase
VSLAGLTAEEVAVRDDEQDFYGKGYWLTHQVQDLGQADIHERARADLPERCMHWLRTVLRYKPPPARVLEVGCAHGGFVALLRWAGYDANGLELSPWVAEFARQTFAVPMLLGPVENQPLPEGSLDVIVLNDVVEHLVDPLATLTCCARLLKEDGALVVQMPCYPEGVSYQELHARKDRFLEMMDGMGAQHVHLFSRRAARQLFDRLGFTALDFVPALFDHYDMYLVTSRQALVRHGPEALAGARTATPEGRLALAWLELLFRVEAGDAECAARLGVIRGLEAALGRSEAECAARLEVIRRLDAECAARLEVIAGLEAALRRSEAECAARLDVIQRLAGASQPRPVEPAPRPAPPAGPRRGLASWSRRALRSLQGLGRPQRGGGPPG